MPQSQSLAAAIGVKKAHSYGVDDECGRIAKDSCSMYRYAFIFIDTQRKDTLDHFTTASQDENQRRNLEPIRPSC